MLEHSSGIVFVCLYIHTDECYSESLQKSEVEYIFKSCYLRYNMPNLCFKMSKNNDTCCIISIIPNVFNNNQTQKKTLKILFNGNSLFQLVV